MPVGENRRKDADVIITTTNVMKATSDGFCVRCRQIPTSTAGLEPSAHYFAERSTNLHLRVHSTVPRHMVVCANLSVWVLSHDTERQNQFVLLRTNSGSNSMEVALKIF